MSFARSSIAVGAAVAIAGSTALITVPASAAPLPNARAVPIPITHVYMTKTGHVRMPTQLRTGMREFLVNSGRQGSLQFAKPRPGYTKAEAARDINRGLDHGNTRALKRFENHVRLLGGVSAGPNHTGEMWRVFRPGKYWAVDTKGPAMGSKFLTVHVRGIREKTFPLPPQPTISAIHEISWAKRPRAIPHQGVLRFRNASTDNHLLAMIKLARGKTMADFRRWVNSGASTKPPLNFKHHFSFGAMSPGLKMSATYSQPRGKYVLLCFWPDADHGGMPHFLMGMYRGITLF